MQDLRYGIWRNDNAKRFAVWEEVMLCTTQFFNKMTQLGYEDRIGQQDMSYDIIESIRDKQNIIVEASVGIGKSYAYLIPLMFYYKITGKPFIVSTSTITLQEQIEKDIIKLSNLLKIPIEVTIAKGKNNYLCKERLFYIYDKLNNKNLPYRLIIQSDGSSQIKTKEEFKDNENSVLLSTGTFWEGIDIKGRSLSSVIIVRLPFPIFDPVIQYKSSLVKDYMSVYLPEMIIKLKQGIGRLIRCDTDKGIIAILDSRIGDSSNSKYKKQVFDCIKAVNKTSNLEDVKKFVKVLQKQKINF